MNESHDLPSEFLNKEYAHSYMEDFLNASIATQIKVLREQQGWSKADLAARAEMPCHQVTAMENVNYSSWSLRALRKLAKAFDLRLKIAFETFSSGIMEVDRFGRTAFQRSPRTSDLAVNYEDPEPPKLEATVSEWLASRSDQIRGDTERLDDLYSIHLPVRTYDVLKIEALQPSVAGNRSSGLSTDAVTFAENRIAGVQQGTFSQHQTATSAIAGSARTISHQATYVAASQR